MAVSNAEILNLKPAILQRQSALCLEFLQAAQTACQSGQAVDRTLAKLFRQRKELGARDRRLLQQVIFGVFRWQGWLTRWLWEKPLSALLLAGLLDQNPWNTLYDYWAAAEHWPCLEKDFILPSALAAKQTWLEEYTGQVVALRSLVPAWFLKASEGIAELDDTELVSCLQSLQTSPPVWIRLQTDHPNSVSAEFAQKQIPVISSPLPQSLGFSKKIDVHTLAAFKQGAFEIQDIASQCVGWICNPQPGERWWDVCAGAGGKSLHLAALMRNRGKVLSTEIRPSMITEIRNRARRGNWSCIKAKSWKGERLPDGVDGLFDGVLVDAPCSGTGTWGRNADLRWRTFPDMIQAHAQEQQLLLARVQALVRPGGKLIYATCSLTERENTRVVQAFLACYPDFHLETFAHPLTRKMTTGQLTIWPHEFNSNGMFMACLLRN